MNDTRTENLTDQAFPKPAPVEQPDIFIDHARSFDSIASSTRRRRLSKLGIGAGVALALKGLLEMNQPHVPPPNKVELGSVTIDSSAVLRTQARVESRIDAEQGKDDPRISRDNLTLDGHSLATESFNIQNALTLEFPGGDTYVIIKGVQQGDKTLDLAVDITDQGVRHKGLEGFADIQPDGTVRNNNGEIISADKIEQYSFPESKEP